MKVLEEGIINIHILHQPMHPYYVIKINENKALLILATQESLSAIDLKGLEKFFWSVRLPNGSFIMH